MTIKSTFFLWQQELIINTVLIILWNMLLLLTFYTKVPIKMITSVAALEIRNLSSLSCVTNKYHGRGNKSDDTNVSFSCI